MHKGLLLSIISIIIGALAVMSNPTSNGDGNDKDENKNWHLKNRKSVKAYGANLISLRDELSESAPSKKTVVAIIDSGVDTEHEDLKEAIWVNGDEIPGNGKDDDNNGFIDDVHGWNFLVDDQGNDINSENLEATRILRLDSILSSKGTERPEWLNKEMRIKALEIYKENELEFKIMKSLAEIFTRIDSVSIAATGKDDYEYKDVFKLKSKDPGIKQAKKIFRFFSIIKVSKKELLEGVAQADKYGDYYLNKNFATRSEFDYSSPGYGNNHYEGDHADHGTHVAGIVAANSMNSKGADGCSTNSAELMVLRVVPDGDEYDQDVANAIRYAVDNGAQIINMSFGKGISPYPNEVREAFQYASDNNVLLVHAAGNDSQNNDKEANYPNADGLENISLVTVGALAPHKNKKMVAEFSNYGKESVDIFAPGDEIFSTVPSDKYEFMGGTSMAAPVVSGVAALIWSYNPDLSAKELQEILLQSSLKVKKKVRLPGNKKTKVSFNELSATGGVIDAHNAFRLARERDIQN